MDTQVSRRQFLRGDRQARHAPVRPPWASVESVFIDLCDRCGDCVERCPQAILHAGSGGYPEVDFRAGACSFCGDCAAACRTGALSLSADPSPWIPQLNIAQRCLAYKRVDCRVCAEQCEHSAIRFVPVLRSVARPQVDIDLCTGCGACVAPCPSGAIVLTPNTSQGKQQ